MNDDDLEKVFGNSSAIGVKTFVKAKVVRDPRTSEYFAGSRYSSTCSLADWLARLLPHSQDQGLWIRCLHRGRGLHEGVEGYGGSELNSLYRFLHMQTRLIAYVPR